MGGSFADAIHAGWIGITTTVNTGAGSAAPTSFAVHPEQLPTLRAGFQQAKDKLLEIRNKAGDLRYIDAPGADEVSVKAVKQLGKKAGDDDGCLGKAVNDALARVQHVIDQVDATMQTYQRTEDHSAGTFSPRNQ
jgi:hypothetical protein